jgi:hypothetical protein
MHLIILFIFYLLILHYTLYILSIFCLYTKLKIYLFDRRLIITNNIHCILLSYLLTYTTLYIISFYWNYFIKSWQKLASLAGRPEGGHIQILYTKLIIQLSVGKWVGYPVLSCILYIILYIIIYSIYLLSIHKIKNIFIWQTTYYNKQHTLHIIILFIFYLLILHYTIHTIHHLILLKSFYKIIL